MGNPEVVGRRLSENNVKIVGWPEAPAWDGPKPGGLQPLMGAGIGYICAPSLPASSGVRVIARMKKCPNSPNGTSARSRPFHGEGIDFLVAGIAGEHRRAVSGDANLRVGEVDLAVGSERKVPQICDALRFPVRYLNANQLGACSTQHIIKIRLVACQAPLGNEAGSRFMKLGPGLGVGVKHHEC